MVTDVIKWNWELPASKMSNSDCQNKDRLSVCRIFLIQQKPQLGSTKPPSRPHAARGLDIPDLKHLMVHRVSAGDLINKIMYDWLDCVATYIFATLQSLFVYQNTVLNFHRVKFRQIWLCLVHHHVLAHHSCTLTGNDVFRATGIVGYQTLEDFSIQR